MQRAKLLKEATWAGWLAVAVAICVMGWTPSAKAQVPAGEKGVVVEEVGEGSALEKAGLRPGDVVLAWERLPAPPANPQGAHGAIESVFDWMWLTVEQAPRGTLKLTGQRGREVIVFEVVPGKWEATVLARMPESMLADYARGKELIDAENLKAGVDLWRKITETAESQAGDRLLCWLFLRFGKAWSKVREWEKAHDAFRSALEATKDPLARVAIWRAIGYAYRQANEFEAAQEAYDSAQEIRGKTWGESLTFAMGLNDLGVLNAIQGRLDAAEGYWQRVVEIRQKLAPGSLAVAAILNNLGVLASRRGDLDRAAEYYERNLEITQKLAPGSLDVADGLGNLGILASDRGDLDRAAEYHESSLEIFQKLVPSSIKVAKVLNNLGHLAWRRGDLDQAADYYEGSLEILQKLVPSSIEVAKSLNNLGILARQRGDLDRAAEYYEESLKFFKKLAPSSLDMSASLNNLGILATERGDLERATEYFEESLEIFQKLAPGSLDVATSLNSLGVLVHDRGDLNRAAEYYEEALEIRQGLAPGSLDVSTSLSNLGALAYDRGDLDRAAVYYERSLEITQRLAPGSLEVAVCLHNLGNLSSRRGDRDRAAEHYERSLEFSQKWAPNSSAVAETMRALAVLRRKQNQPRAALSLFRQALKALENQVDRLGGSQDVRAGFRAEYVAYYRDTIDLLLELHQTEEAFHILERSRARSFLAQLAERDLVFSDIPEELEQQRRHIAWNYNETQDEIAQLNPREQEEEIEALLTQLRQLRWDREDIAEEIVKASPKLGALRYPQPLGLDDARQALDLGTVMLSYSVGKDETHLFVLTREKKLRVKTLPLAEEELRGEVERVLELQKRRSAPLFYTQPLRQVGERLYQALIQPAEESIAQSERVLIVPDGPLHLLPFALLVRKTGPGERDFEYLVEWKPLHSALSATVYAELKDLRRTEPDESADVLALAAFGDPRYSADFRPLPDSREEVNRTAALYPEGAARTFLGAEASEEQAKSVGESARILHFATHGRYDERFPLNSYLVLTIPKEFRKDQDNGLLQAWEIFEEVRLDADLVVLSACESGLGDEIDGEGLKGLTRAFQFAGARTVAATLWKVEDRATTELMLRFYRHLGAGMSKDEALRAAQLELIRGPVEVKDRQGRVVPRDLSMPYYWAAFQMIGDWQ